MAIPSLDFDPYSEEVLTNPFQHHHKVREAAPVVWLEQYRCFALARFEEVRAALMNWEVFVSSRGVGLADFAHDEPWRPPSLLLEADPPLHQRTRGLMNKITALPALKRISFDWRSKADALVADLVNRGGTIDAVAALAEAFPLSVFPDLIGLREEGRENLIPYATSVFNAFGPRNRLLEVSLEEAKLATAWVAESCRRDHLRPGGWGEALYLAADNGECSAGEAERLVRSFLSAGVDTTVNGIANLIHAFAENPDQWQLLRDDPTLIRKAIEESLRWGGVAQTFYRTTNCDVVVSGELIPRDSKVLLFLAAANRDPCKWTNPDKFDILRNVSGHVGFGFGIHQCLGQMVARLEAEAVIGALVQRVRAIEPAGEIVRRLNNTLFAIGQLPVRLVPG